MKMSIKTWKNGFLILQFILLFLSLQLLLNPSYVTPQSISASPSALYPDVVWEGSEPDYNDDPSHAYDFSDDKLYSSLSHDPKTPPTVSTWSPDYYNFTVYPGFYFRVEIEFNQSDVYNSTGHLIDLTDPSLPFGKDPDFVADLDLELFAANGTRLDYSFGNSNEETVGPIYTTLNEEFMIHVFADQHLGYKSINYSTNYNMSIVLEDIYETLQPNDYSIDGEGNLQPNNYFSDPRDPFSDCDDEIIPKTYDNLRFSRDSWTDYGSSDLYIIFLYDNSFVTITMTAFRNGYFKEDKGPNFILYAENSKFLDSYDDDDSIPDDTYFFNTKYSGWYYFAIDNAGGLHDYYSLDIDLEDSIEIETGGNNHNSTATPLSKKTDYYSGLVVAEGQDDWYRIKVNNSERLMVETYWFTFPSEKTTLNLALYNTSDHSLVGEADPICPPGVNCQSNPQYKGLRVGPINSYNASGKDAWYFVHISSDNKFPRYYNLSIIIAEVDDWAEDNDNPNEAYLLPTTSKTYAPTEDDPLGGLFSLKGDYDWFAFSLLPGDNLTVTIEFNGTLADLSLGIADGDGTILDVSALPSSNSETVSYKARKIDIYLIAIAGLPSSYATNGVNYNMTVIIDEMDDSFESNDKATESAAIAEGHYPDLILREGDADYYHVYLASSDVINISLNYFAQEYGEEPNLEQTDLELDLLFANQSLAARSHNIGLNESISYNASESGKYYIVCSIYEESNNYNLTIDITETDDPYEDNDVLADATRISFIEGVPTETVTNVTTGLLMRVKDDDYYVTKLPAGLAIIVEVSGFGDEDFALELLSKNGSVLDSSDNGVGVPEEVGPLPMNSTYTALYNSSDVYFRVSMATGLSATYTLTITIGPEALLITRETVPPFTEKTTTKKPFDPLPGIILGAAIGGTLIGGGAAAIYAAKKTGVVGKIGEKFKKPPPGGDSPPSGKTTGIESEKRKSSGTDLKKPSK